MCSWLSVEKGNEQTTQPTESEKNKAKKKCHTIHDDQNGTH